MNYIKSLSFICLAIAILTGAAFAQMPTSDRSGSGFALDDNGVPYSNKYFPGKASDNVISLIRKPELTEDQFILRITDSHVMNGCVDISDYAYSAEYRDIYLDISIDGLTVDMRKQPQYAHYQCNKATQQPTADIILNRQDLVQNETQQIRLHNGTTTNYYNITLTDNMVKILPDPADEAIAKRFKPHHIASRKTSLLYWFYPVGTVVMWVPGGERDADTSEKLGQFARTKGLVPLSEIYPNFESPLTSTQYHYFVDTSGRFADDDAELADGKPVGTIKTKKLVYGLEKDEYVLDEMTVYAKLPGMYE